MNGRQPVAAEVVALGEVCRPTRCPACETAPGRCGRSTGRPCRNSRRGSSRRSRGQPPRVRRPVSCSKITTRWPARANRERRSCRSVRRLRRPRAFRAKRSSAGGRQPEDSSGSLELRQRDAALPHAQAFAARRGDVGGPRRPRTRARDGPAPSASLARALPHDTVRAEASRVAGFMIIPDALTHAPSGENASAPTGYG